MKILILEDEAALSDAITEFLIESGYAVKQCFDGDEAFNAAYEGIYDLWLLDVSVPGIDGFSLLKELRASGKNTPAIFITSHQKANDVKIGFDAGADDYLKKPFEMTELLARIENIRRRSFAHLQQEQVMVCKNAFFDITKDRLSVDNENVELRKKELLLLKLLLKNRGKTLSYEEIFEGVWEYGEEAGLESLRTHIKTLKHKLKCDEAIESVRGLGYRLAGG